MVFGRTVTVDIDVDDVLDEIADRDKLSSCSLDSIIEYLKSQDASDDESFNPTTVTQIMWNYIKNTYRVPIGSIDEFKEKALEIIDDNYYLIKRN